MHRFVLAIIEIFWNYASIIHVVLCERSGRCLSTSRDWCDTGNFISCWSRIHKHIKYQGEFPSKHIKERSTRTYACPGEFSPKHIKESSHPNICIFLRVPARTYRGECQSEHMHIQENSRSNTQCFTDITCMFIYISVTGNINKMSCHGRVDKQSATLTTRGILTMYIYGKLLLGSSRLGSSR